MFCKYCGAQLEDGSAFCNKCGGNLNAAPAQPKPQAAQPAAKKPVNTGDILGIIKANLRYIIAGIAVIALIWGILNVFSVFHINGKVSGYGQSKSEYVSVGDSDGLDGIGAVYVGNILFGLALLAAAAIGALYFLKQFKNMPYYDQFIAKYVKFRPTFMMGILGIAGALLQMLLYLFCGTSFMGVKVSVGVNWTTWLLLVVFIAVVVYDKLVLEKEEKAEAQALAEEAPVEE